jgi:hypothetical protein
MMFVIICILNSDSLQILKREGILRPSFDAIRAHEFFADMYANILPPLAPVLMPYTFASDWNKVKSREAAMKTAKPVIVRPGCYYPAYESDEASKFLVKDCLVNFECPDAWRFDHLHGETVFSDSD